MNIEFINRHRSWFYSVGIAVLITMWLLSGLASDEEQGDGDAQLSVATIDATQSKVRVRTQSAEEVVRTIIVNGKTAPARIVELSAETDGRVEFTDADRGANVARGGVIVRLDERDRKARLSQARATVKQREVEYEGRRKLCVRSAIAGGNCTARGRED